MIIKLTLTNGKLFGVNPMQVLTVEDISDGNCRIFVNAADNSGKGRSYDVPGTLDDIIGRLNSK